MFSSQCTCHGRGGFDAVLLAPVEVRAHEQWLLREMAHWSCQGNRTGDWCGSHTWLYASVVVRLDQGGARGGKQGGGHSKNHPHRTKWTNVTKQGASKEGVKQTDGLTVIF